MRMTADPKSVEFPSQPFNPTSASAAPKRLRDLFHGDANVAHFQPGRSILVQGDEIETLYEVVAGTVRCCTFTEDGRRQIFRFVRSGDLLGFVDVDRWHFTAEAVDGVILRSIGRDFFEAALAESPALRRDLRALVSRELEERERQLTVLAFKPADQRLLWFLRDFTERRGKTGFLALPMTRLEIGDYLGLSLETVSRSFGALRRAGLIEMRGSEKFRLVENEPLLTPAKEAA